MKQLRAFSWLMGLAPCVLRAAETNAPPAALPATAAGTNAVWRLEAADRGEFEFDPVTGQASAANGVIVSYGGARLTAQRVTVDQATGEVSAEGDVMVHRDGGLWTGERMRFNFLTGQFQTEAFRAGFPPYFVAGGQIRSAALSTNDVFSPSNRVYTVTNAVFTTEDSAQPRYRIRARVLTLVPDQYIEGKDAVVYLGDTPVFYFPFLRRSLERHPNNWEFTPGYRNNYGAYLLNAYNWQYNRQLSGSVHLNAYTQRGVGGGPDLFWRPDGWGEGELRGFYIYDLKPGEDAYGQNISHNRDRIYFSHHAAFTTNFTATAMVRYQSDMYVVRDFAETEYHENNQPTSYLEVNHDTKNWNLNLLSQFQVNNFQDTADRLPELRLTGLRQQLGESPFFYESQSSLGYYGHNYPNIDTNQLYSLTDSNYFGGRFDTYHKLLAPFTFFGWLNFTPRVGGRYTGYTEATGPGATTGDESRFVLDTGAEASFRASRVFRGAESRWFDVRGLRHIVEPWINYSFVPAPNVDSRRLPQYDYLVPDFNLLPLEYPSYNSIDAIGQQNVMRLGLRNKLQTKREEGVDNLLNWALYTDWHVDQLSSAEQPLVYYQGQFLTQPAQTSFSDLYSDLDFKPRDWITFNSRLRYNAVDWGFNEINNGVTINPGENWSVSAGQRWRNDTGLLELNNNLIFGSLYLKLNENYALRASEFFDANAGVMQYQYYTLYRDFRSWTGGLTFRVRRNDDGGTPDFGFAVTFSLKAFPRYKLGSDMNRPSLLLGS